MYYTHSIKLNNKNKWHKRVVTCFVAIILLIVISAIAFAYSGPPQNGENIYGTVPFPVEYAGGYINITNTTPGSSLIKTNLVNPGGTVTCYGYNNTTKNTSIYLDHYNSAYMNRKYYDIREYVWQTGNDYWRVQPDNGTEYLAQGPEAHTISREFHFYESGHCGDPAYELQEFRGIIRYGDLDGNDTMIERVRINQGFVGAWLSNPTYVVKDTASTSPTWKGTFRNDNSVRCTSIR